ncbi:UBP-type zinc finger domain-containing protein [Longispora albida]|uniref:UBP-type zinc finger domain-containing protein n=1 Tax=Longispora albida TaxID=203523 RepID=UPI000380E6AC|nr:UBP-type zinc finger domain-containing protein [Longispora albida]
MSSSCEHLAVGGELPGNEVDVCGECVAVGHRDWVHLRQCLSCGHVACCDSSPYRHATGHFHATRHPVMRSAEPGEAWRWCYVDEVLG